MILISFITFHWTNAFELILAVMHFKYILHGEFVECLTHFIEIFSFK